MISIFSSLLLQIEYPEIEELTKPRHRFMSSYEQVYDFDFIDLCLSSSVLMSSFSISVFLTYHIFLWTQRVQPFDKRYQYLLFAAEPYEIIAFKVNHCSCLFFCLMK